MRATLDEVRKISGGPGFSIQPILPGGLTAEEDKKLTANIKKIHVPRLSVLLVERHTLHRLKQRNMDTLKLYLVPNYHCQYHFHPRRQLSISLGIGFRLQSRKPPTYQSFFPFRGMIMSDPMKFLKNEFPTKSWWRTCFGSFVVFFVLLLLQAPNSGRRIGRVSLSWILVPFVLQLAFRMCMILQIVQTRPLSKVKVAFYIMETYVFRI